MVRVQEGVHPVETGQEPGGQIDGVEDCLVALQVVEARHASLPVRHRAGLRARQIQSGQDLQGFVIQLDQSLAAIAPDCPLPIGVRARDQTPEVARPEPGELPLVVG